MNINKSYKDYKKLEKMVDSKRFTIRGVGHSFVVSSDTEIGELIIDFISVQKATAKAKFKDDVSNL
jgi:hypothetical protein